jgi:Fe-Mn family superoxide dismutase
LLNPNDHSKSRVAQEERMNFDVPPLPYPKDALEPAIGRNTLEFHYEKHHKGYMTKLKAAIEGKPDADKSLEEIVKTAKGEVFNNAAQVWNHTFFWESMQPDGGGAPPHGPVLDLLTRDFGGWDKFRIKFIQAGMKRFGSGWAWLVLQDGKAKIVSTANADTPLKSDVKVLLTADVWEHAYYLDYQNKRDTFLETFCDKLINWNFVLRNLQA